MKIMVAMSGGVDSTITAYLLQKEGHYIEGVYMQLFDDEDYHQKNLKNIELVCNYLNINYHILDLREEFKKEVYDEFIKTYKLGKTPNPCIRCNRHIKLGKLYEFMISKGFDKLATGHYARIKNGKIISAKDKSKDQSYFLSNIQKSVVDRVIFPLGDIYKEDVKVMASNIDILKSIAKQKESSEICFVPNSYLDILNQHFNTYQEGEVLDIKGNVIGKHFGYMRYTIGQRKGFRLRSAHQPHYVLKIIPQKNQIIVGTKEQLYQKKFFVENLNLFIPSKDKIECQVKIRYRSNKTPCILYPKDNKVILKEPQAGIASGQTAAFYFNEEIIGSGIIV